MAATEPADDLVVTGLTKVSEARVGRTDFDYVFKVSVRNASTTPYQGVALALTSAGPGATVIDGSVTVGNIAAGAVTLASDTVTIRQDRTRAFNAATLVWTIAGTPDSTPQAQLAALEDAGTIPKLERGNVLAGVDLNGNGIRDDVEAYISKQFTDPAQRAAALQTAKGLQAALLVNPQDRVAAKAASLRLGDAIHCIYVRFSITGPTPPGKVVTDLEAVTTNTKQRLLAYLAYNKALDGTTSALPEGNTCE